MADAARPHHSRSSSISKNPRSHSHQRKASMNNISLYPIDEHGAAAASSSSSSSSSWQQFFQGESKGPMGPLLPHDKQSSVAFGGPSKAPWYQSLVKSPIVRFIGLLYVSFSIFLSLQHLWTWWTAPIVDERFGADWIPQRTYDQDMSYSVVDAMTHGLAMSKLFAKANYKSSQAVQPYWIKAAYTPDPDSITATTVVTIDTWKELERLAERWKGPLSVTVHIVDDVTSRSRVKELYEANADLVQRADIHLSPTVQAGVSVLLPRNAERNLARMFARSDFVLDLPSHVLPVTDLQRTLATNKEMFTTLLRNGDVLVVPTFGFPEQEGTQFRVPPSKTRLLEMVDTDAIHMVDKHWKPNTGPTDMDAWKTATTLYRVERYDFHYEPIVIQSKTVQPWCAERFLDSRSACLFSTYLAGSEFWVLPDDFAIDLPPLDASNLSDFDHVIENRLYAKFYWEQCVHHARQLDSLGLWKGKRSEHIRTQCSRVIQNWGKGLIGKPE